MTPILCPNCGHDIDAHRQFNHRECDLIGCNCEWQPSDIVTAIRAQDAVRIAELEKWKDAIVDAGVVNWTLSEENANDPRRAVGDLLTLQTQIALDPKVSQPADELHSRIAALEGENKGLDDALADANFREVVLRELLVDCELAMDGAATHGIHDLLAPEYARHWAATHSKLRAAALAKE